MYYGRVDFMIKGRGLTELIQSKILKIGGVSELENRRSPILFMFLRLIEIPLFIIW